MNEYANPHPDEPKSIPTTMDFSTFLIIKIKKDYLFLLFFNYLYTIFD